MIKGLIEMSIYELHVIKISFESEHDRAEIVLPVSHTQRYYVESQSISRDPGDATHRRNK